MIKVILIYQDGDNTQEYCEPSYKIIFFKEMWEENYIWDCEAIEDLVADHCNDFIEDQFKKLLNQKDMRLFLMQEMLKQVSKKVEEWNLIIQLQQL